MMQAAVFDLDGVIRHFDPSRTIQIAEEHGLSVDDLVKAAFEPSRLRRLTVGDLTRAQWVEEVGRTLSAPAAADAWLTGNIGIIDDAVIEVIEELRASGVPVAILTNGTDTIEQELATLGVLDRFDLIVSTWHLGVAKPDPRAYAHVCSQLRVAPSEAFFTDDRQENVDAALALGMEAHQFRGVAGLRRALRL